MSTRTTLRRSVLFAIPLIVLTGGMTGCGRPSGSVTGTVTFQGRPLDNGSVILYCQDQQIIHGPIGPDGAYAIPDVPRGPARVTVRVAGRQREQWLRGQRTRTPPVINGPVIPASRPPDKESRTWSIPERYSVPEESGLTVTVEGGVTAFDIRLTR
jgi:hypothetical protein